MQKVCDIIEAGNEIDIVFFDLPGTVNNRGVVNILNCMDTVIVPVAADKVILESSLAFALKIQEWLTTGRTQVKQMYMLWNLVDAREKTDLYDQYEAVFEEYGLMTLKTKIPDTKSIVVKGQRRSTAPCFARPSCLLTRHCLKVRACRSLQMNCSDFSNSDLYGESI